MRKKKTQVKKETGTQTANLTVREVVKDMPVVLRNSKSSLFCMVFNEKEKLLGLYNAVNGTDYDNPDDLVVNTLENAIYMNMKNDLSFIIDGRMNLYEHQSTLCPNMPLRDLSYVSRLYEKEMRNSSIYSARQIKIPAPRFITFYNGTKDAPEQQVLKLSDAYLTEEYDPELELKVTVLNINKGKNKELLDKCKTLQDYMIYVELVREYSRELSIREAVEKAVQECIRRGVLAEFLKKYRAEAVAMTIFEYDEEEHMKLIAEEAAEEANKRLEEERRGREEERRGREEERRGREEERRGREKAEAELSVLKKQLAELQKHYAGTQNN